MRILIAAISTLMVSQTAVAQRDSGLPRVGDQLPDLSAFDDAGREFSLSELKGDYSVLVFGCLT